MLGSEGEGYSVGWEGGCELEMFVGLFVGFEGVGLSVVGGTGGNFKG